MGIDRFRRGISLHTRHSHRIHLPTMFFLNGAMFHLMSEENMDPYGIWNLYKDVEKKLLKLEEF